MPQALRYAFLVFLAVGIAKPLAPGETARSPEGATLVNASFVSGAQISRTPSGQVLVGRVISPSVSRATSPGGATLQGVLIPGTVPKSRAREWTIYP